MRNNTKPFYSFLFCVAILSMLHDSEAQTTGVQSAQQIDTTFRVTGAFYALSVPDVEASSKWYTENLGLKVVTHVPVKDNFGLSILEGHGVMIELVQEVKALPLSTVAPTITQPQHIHGIYKVGFIVDDTSKIVHLLKSKGIKIVMGPYPARPGIRSNLAIRDNSGNLVMFIGK
jgi:catechol 2,3-dioxygenase-like lactoylglutathione lyase family enzyme